MPRMDGLTFLAQNHGAAPAAGDHLLGAGGSGQRPSGPRARARRRRGHPRKPRVGIKRPPRGVASANRACHSGGIRRAARAADGEVARRAARGRHRRQVRSACPCASPRYRRRVPAPPSSRPPENRVVVIGASTGGTEALAVVLAVAAPPTHRASSSHSTCRPGFTAAFARRLDQVGPPGESRSRRPPGGEPIAAGSALIAPGNRHITVRSGRSPKVVLPSDDAPVNHHRPSVDVLFRSAATGVSRRRGAGYPSDRHGTPTEPAVSPSCTNTGAENDRPGRGHLGGLGNARLGDKLGRQRARCCRSTTSPPRMRWADEGTR